MRFIEIKMENMNATIAASSNLEVERTENNACREESFKDHIDEILANFNKLEKRVTEVEEFYLNASNNQFAKSEIGLAIKNKDKEKHVPSIKKQQQEATRREAAAAKRMQELMRQFGTIVRQITQHKWAWPFMQPVDVEGLGLQDYYQIIDRPMDFSTIKNQMEARYGTGYRSVRDICSDVKLVFKNAMQYNDESSDVYVMAKTLLEKFEEKWLQFLPKVTEEEKRRAEEERDAQLNMQLAQEAAHAKLARDLCNELNELDVRLKELGEIVVKKCRKLPTEEKRNLGVALSQLCPEDLSKALEIVAQSNPNFQAKAEEVDLDLDAQSDSTLWRLKFLVKDVLEEQHKSSSKGGYDYNANWNAAPSTTNVTKPKPKRRISQGKTSKTKNLKQSS